MYRAAIISRDIFWTSKERNSASDFSFATVLFLCSMQQKKAIIFDLGGVLLDIDFKLSEKAFAELGVTNFSDFFNQFHSNDLFRRLETGMNDQLFYDDLRSATGLSLSDEQIRDAWNALLLDFRPESVAVLPQLREKYDLYLLSNTNEIHLQEFQRRYEAWRPGQVFDDLFDAAYYSHRIGHRKPNASAFEYVLEKHGLNATETIFIDDSFNNIEAAQQLGLQTVHLKAGMKVEELGLM
jgi:glucose-1-phosphatase